MHWFYIAHFIHINVQMHFTNNYKADSWESYIDCLLQRLTNIYIHNVSSRRDRPHNVEITTLLFTVHRCVWVLLSLSIEGGETGPKV